MPGSIHRPWQGSKLEDTSLVPTFPRPPLVPPLKDPTKPLNAKPLQNAWARLLTQAGLRHVRIHDLRYTYTSSQLQAGKRFQYVKQQLRHSTIRLTVDLYGHLIPGKGRAAVQRLEERTSAQGDAARNANGNGTGYTHEATQATHEDAASGALVPAA